MDSITNKVKAYGQEHLLKYWDELTEDEKKVLSSQIEAADFSLLEKIDDCLTMKASGDIAPMEAFTIPMIEAGKEKYEAAGLAALKAGKLACVLLAGGQGTRLGVDKSKGLVDIGITKPLYIFECLINNMLRVVKQVGSYIHLYVMTSTINDEAIREFLKEKNYFGYDENYITFFVQDMCPAISTSKKLFLSSKYELALSPNGNGGWFLSLQSAGLIEQMKADGVEWLNVFAVDNVLQKMADPVFFGAVLERGCDSGTKVIRKANPEEKVGVMCLRGGRPSVVEYTELSEQMRYEKNEADEYCYNFGVILNYLFRIDKLESLTGNSALHIAHKKIKHLNDEGIVVEPDEPNGYKFETFIIDMVEFMSDCLVYEVVREKEFAPIKNKVGVDSVDTARALLEMNGVIL